MGFDIKDITDILPFVFDNLSVCAYIIVISSIFGFFIGKQFEKYNQKKKIAELKSQLSNQEEVLKKVSSEKNQLVKEIGEISNKYEKLKDRTQMNENGQMNSGLSSLAALDRMLGSEEGQLELTALIEFNYRKEIKVSADVKTE